MSPVSSVHPSDHLSIHSFIHSFINPCICPSIHPSVSQSVRPRSVCPSLSPIYPSIHSSIHPCMHNNILIIQSLIYLFIYLFITVLGLHWKIPVLLMLGFIMIFLYEHYTPGSMLRYWYCKRGSIQGRTLSFVFKTHDHQVKLVSMISKFLRCS